MLVTCPRCEAHVDTGATPAGATAHCRCGQAFVVPEAPAIAGRMACPACGASVDPDHAACEFCRSKLATVICPGCFGLVFDGARHCPHCGGVLTRQNVVHHGDATRRRCPRCPGRPHLRIEVIAGAPIERCAECEGLWVEADVVERIYRARRDADVVGATTARDRGAPAVAEAPAIEPVTYIPCPDCGKLMNRRNFARFSGVILDICKGHGTWFDAGELRRVVAFIQDGGLEKKARREREELQEELRRLRAATTREQSRAAVAGTPAGARFVGGWGALSISVLLRDLL